MPGCWKHLSKPNRASSISALNFKDRVLERTQISRAVFPCFRSVVANSGCVEESHLDINPVYERAGSGSLENFTVLRRTQNVSCCLSVL